MEYTGVHYNLLFPQTVCGKHTTHGHIYVMKIFLLTTNNLARLWVDSNSKYIFHHLIFAFLQPILFIKELE
jgi:hypothetical protein